MLDPIAAARDTAAKLQSAASAYVEALRAAPGDYYPGINALTLGRLWDHVTRRQSRLPLDLIAQGITWTAAAAAERSKDYWSLATRAELALIEDRKAEVAALAVANRDWFASTPLATTSNFSARSKFHRDYRYRSRRGDRSRRASGRTWGAALGVGSRCGVQRAYDR